MFVESYYHELLSPSSVEDVHRPRPLLDHIQKDGQADCKHELDLWEAGGTRRKLRAENPRNGRNPETLLEDN
ncbi:Dynein heavy chain, cytoplasmic [Venturia inaequalis]|nr:Dynein heavy chain, cytoplasmic [Venturia inaequalis]